MLVKTVGLGKVQDVELDLSWLVRLVANLEVIPLCVSLSVEVVLEPQVVLNVVNFGSLP